MNDANERWKVLTVPNLLSLFRIALVVPIAAEYRAGNMPAAAILVLLSGATDVADGWYARKFSCVTDLGKILDPIADKLTLGALIFCLSGRYPQMILLLTVFVMREFVMAGLGIRILHRFDTVGSSRWYGKAATAVLYAGVLVLLLLPSPPDWAVKGMTGTGTAAILLGFLGYLGAYAGMLRGGAANN